MSKKHKKSLKQLPFYFILCLNLALVILHWQCSRSKGTEGQLSDEKSILSYWNGEADMNNSGLNIKDI
jgi:hypothetical protein